MLYTSLLFQLITASYALRPECSALKALYQNADATGQSCCNGNVYTEEIYCDDSSSRFYIPNSHDVYRTTTSGIYNIGGGQNSPNSVYLPLQTEIAVDLTKLDVPTSNPHTVHNVGGVQKPLTASQQVFKYVDGKAVPMSANDTLAVIFPGKEKRLRIHEDVKENHGGSGVPNAANMAAAAELGLNYFLKRGFAVGVHDLPEKFEGVLMGFVGGSGPNSWATMVKFDGIEKMLFSFFNIDSAPLENECNAGFEPFVTPEDTTSFSNNGKMFGMQIPIFTDTSAYRSATGAKALYNKFDNLVTIHVPAGAKHLISTKYVNVGNVQYDAKAYMNGFDGTFALRRQVGTELVPATPSEVTVLVQASESITATTLHLDKGVEKPQTFVSPQLTDEGRFRGIFAFNAHGGSDAFDVYIYNINALNGFAWIQPGAGAGYDNPETLQEEAGFVYSAMTFLDHPAWPIILSTITDQDKFINPPTYEAMTAQGGMEGLVVSSVGVNDKFIALLFMHELLHNIHQQYLLSGVMDLEAQAVAIEFDPKGTGQLAYFRGYAFATYLLSFTRGRWPFGLSTRGSKLHPGRGHRSLGVVTYADRTPGMQYNEYYPNERDLMIYEDYGAAMQYMFITANIDPNFQVIRRALDIMGNELWVPKLEEQGIVFTKPFTYYRGWQLAVNQSLAELHGTSLPDVFETYAITVSLLRNNPGIPDKYKSPWPFHYYSKASKLAPIISSGGTGYWWEDYDGMRPINFSTPDPLHNYNSYVFRLMPDIIEGMTIKPHFNDRIAADEDVILTGGKVTSRSIQSEDLTTQIYVLDASTKKVTCKPDRGLWSFTILQHTMPEDVFMMSGPHRSTGAEVVLDVAPLRQHAGRVLLVASNIGLTDLATEQDPLNNFVRRDEWIYSGKVTLSVSS